MIVGGVWTGVGFSNLKNSRTRIQKFWNRSGIGIWKCDSDHLWFELVFFSTFCSLAPLLFGTSVIWHLCYVAPLLFGGGEDEPMSSWRQNRHCLSWNFQAREASLVAACFLHLWLSVLCACFTCSSVRVSTLHPFQPLLAHHRPSYLCYVDVYCVFLYFGRISLLFLFFLPLFLWVYHMSCMCYFVQALQSVKLIIHNSTRAGSTPLLESLHS